MIAELITVGTEILMGNTINTNAAHLSAKCASLGLSLYKQQVVGDYAESIQEAVAQALGRADIVIMTGGLGTTCSDLTEAAVAAVTGQEAMNHAIEVPNENGLATGKIVEYMQEGQVRHIVLLPGPPSEMEPMFDETVSKYIRTLTPEAIFSKMVKICGLDENAVEQEILDLLEKQTNPTIATYAKTGEVQIRVTAKGGSPEEAKELVKPIVKVLKSRFKDDVYTTDEDESLEEVVVKLLKKKDLQLMTVESCTGGLLAGRIINVSGASEVFQQGFVTYSNKTKRKLVDVDKMTLKKYGAVSKETAKEMAKGGILATNADICVSITGLAGPEADEGKPVGLVYIGCYYNDKVTVREYHFQGNRQKVREQAVSKALDLLRRCMISD